VPRLTIFRAMPEMGQCGCERSLAPDTPSRAQNVPIMCLSTDVI
jgi:hypothetical protein